MNTKSEIIAALEIVAHGLSQFRRPIVYVGGSTVPLYLDSELQTIARPTRDIDCIVEAVTWLDYSRLESQLRKLGFKESMEEGAPRCRRIYKGIQVDIMPTQDSLMGFSTKSYADGFKNAERFSLPSGQSILLFSVPYFFLAKLEAVFDRGKDLRLSADLEDLVTIMAGRKDIERDLRKVTDLKKYFEKLRALPAFEESIYGHMPSSPFRFLNADEILETINRICMR